MARRLGGLLVTVVAAMTLMGCAVHLPATQQASYDYSDYLYYDQGHAPSPGVSANLNAVTPEENRAADSTPAAPTR